MRRKLSYIPFDMSKINLMRHAPTCILNFRSAILSFSSRGERRQPGKVEAFICASISSSSLSKRNTAFDMLVDADAGRADGIFVRGPLLLWHEKAQNMGKIYESRTDGLYLI